MEAELFINLDWAELIRAVVRLLAAIVFGAAIGWERERAHRAAGLRTHILVAVGSAAFMMLGTEMAERSGSGDPTRIIQGVAMGVGFLGGGTILKLPDERKVQGLTTAAGIWTTAAIGVAVGAGWLVLGAALCMLTLVVLALLRRFEV